MSICVAVKSARILLKCVTGGLISDLSVTHVSVHKNVSAIYFFKNVFQNATALCERIANKTNPDPL